MSVNKFRSPSLRDKHEAQEEALQEPTEVEKEEAKIKSSKKPAPNKLKDDK